MNNLIIKYAIKVYIDPLNQRDLIRKDNNDKIGIYCWINNINEKFYIGRGAPLYLRISDYYQNWYYYTCTNLNIVKALTKYGMRNFSLVILEYTNSENIILCEQKWINLLKPSYNYNIIAGNINKYKQTTESLDKISKATLDKKHSK